MNDVCMFTAMNHAEPDQVDAELVGGRSDQRDGDEGELEEVEEERQQEDHDVDDDQEAHVWPPGSDVSKMFHPHVAVHPVEGEREDTRAPTRMKSTKAESLAVASTAWLHEVERSMPALDRWPGCIAPAAPMAPPSVGVATPMKIVPSTRKMSAERRHEDEGRPARPCLRHDAPTRSDLLDQAGGERVERASVGSSEPRIMQRRRAASSRLPPASGTSPASTR